MAPPRKVELYAAVESFVTHINGEPYQVSAGDLFDSNDPILKGREELFKPSGTNHIRRSPMWRPEVEQATAAPGEKRGA